MTLVFSLTQAGIAPAGEGGDNKGKHMLNGWKNAGLPWSYNMSKNKMYIE